MQKVILYKVLGILFILILSFTNCLKKKSSCGITASDSKQSNARIFGGKDAPKNKYPWYIDIVVAFDGNGKKIKQKDKPTMCGGTLISKDCVLTAAHCFFDMGNEDKVIIKEWQNCQQLFLITKKSED